MSAALLPWVRQQFFDANGKPLSGGKVYTYAAGTTTPQAAYTDASGTTALANPVVLDAAGTASLWLGAASYKLVVTDAGGATIATIDNVSAVSLTQLQAEQTFSSLTVSGDATVDGNETVDGTLTAATLTVTGAANLEGALTAASLAVTGNETVGGTLDVTGATTLGDLTAGAATVSSLTIGATSLTDFVTALLPSLTALTGALVISDVAVSGNWVVFTFGTTTGTRIRIALGAGTITNGATISLPTGFSASNLRATVSMNSVDSTSGNNLDTIACSVNSSGVVTATGADHSGHTFAGTANWFGLVYLTGY